MTDRVATWSIIDQDKHHLLLRNGTLSMQIVWCTAKIVRVLVSAGAALPRRSWAVIPPDQQWTPVAWQTSPLGAVVQVASSALTITLDLQNGTVSFSIPQGPVFCRDLAAAECSEIGATLVKAIGDGEYFYGFGERTGLLEKSGQRYTHWTHDPEFHHSARVDEMYATFPVYMAIQPQLAYGVFFNTTFRSEFDIGKTTPGEFRWTTTGPDLDYYLVLGPTPAEVTLGLSLLTGFTPLPPRWALGYHQSRWSYQDESVIRDLAAQFRGRGIPCDAIHVDIDYMDGYRVFTWDSARFPEPASLIADLRSSGFNVVTIIDPGVKTDPEYAVFSAGVAQAMFIKRANGSLFTGYVWPDESAFADYTRPAVREWWGSLHKALLEAGVRGIWDDMNEPSVFERPFSAGAGLVGTIDLDAPQGDPHERTTHAEVHNLYGLLMAQATHEGLLAARPNERPFVLTRSGFVGMQRWATLWTGDNTALWEHLELTLPQICNLGLSGVPFCGVDIGGFFGNASPELWARWVQLGALLPFARGHSCSGTRQAEPWMFGEQVEEIARAYLTLRYRLLPYLYSLFYAAATQGAPIIRPLVYAFPNDLATYQCHDQAMLGPHLLLAPIVRPGVDHRAVYLPQGDWYDWWTGERITGPIHLLAHAPLERLPLYVQGGAIIPLGPALQYTAERPTAVLTLDIYPAGTSTWTLYEDDGLSFDYQSGAWATTTYRCTEADQRLTFEIAARQGAWTPDHHTLLLKLHCPPPRQVLLDGAETRQFQHSDGTMVLELADDGQTHQLVIEL